LPVSPIKKFWDNIILRLVAYYSALIGGAYLAWRFVPNAQEVARGSYESLFSSPSFSLGKQEAVAAAAAATPDQTTLVLTVALAMVSAALLALPMAWVYILTRAKRGYQQSVVQTLIMLPVVVAGVVVMVKYSLALAFALAGIVAAVRFRNTLDDSKDAVYIFLATGTGLAAAVNLPVAVVVSVMFNIVVLLLWVTDFGRTPAQLDGVIGSRRLQRATDTMTKTGTFVARMDRDILQELTAEQLDSVAQRAKRRARELVTEDLGGNEADSGILRVRTYNVDVSRQPVEAVLEDQLKKWEFGRVVVENDGTYLVEYNVRFKKNVPRDAVLETLRRMGAPRVVGAELD
jgi:hypothetical protein